MDVHNSVKKKGGRGGADLKFFFFGDFSEYFLTNMDKKGGGVLARSLLFSWIDTFPIVF